MRLTKNFTLREICKSNTAKRNGVSNIPNEIQVKAIRALAENILQPIRDKFGITKINSGFRSIELERIVCRRRIVQEMKLGGTRRVMAYLERKSHPKGQAADIEVPGVDNRKLYEWIKDNLEYDQLILEYYEDDDPSSGWVHVSWNEDSNREESFEIS